MRWFSAEISENSSYQHFLFSRNVGKVSPKINCFYYLIKPFLDRSIQNIFDLILKTEALLCTSRGRNICCLLPAIARAGRATTSGSFLDEMSGSSLRKLYIFIIYKKIVLWIEVSKKKLFNFGNRTTDNNPGVLTAEGTISHSRYSCRLAQLISK